MPVRPLRLAAATAVAVLALITTATALPAGTETVTSGAVAATLSWDAGPDGQTVDHARLTMTRGGTTVFDQAIGDVVCDACELTSVPAGEHQHGDVGLFDLDHDGEPEVLVEAFTGGTECCVNVGIYDYRPQAATYERIVRSYATNDVSLQDLGHDGRLELVSHDQRFEGKFGDDADAWPPPVVERFQRQGGTGRLVDATRHFPAVVSRDARRAHQLLNRTDLFGVPVPSVLAGYVADEELLGHGDVGTRWVTLLTKRGALGSPRHAAAYRTRLLSLLRRYGYR
jgi:hypothetical protein